MGSRADAQGPGAGAGRSERSAADSDRPTPPPAGMTSQQLADYQKKFTAWSRERILTDGLRQYDQGSQQAFESFTPIRLIDETQEELADIVNYATMLSIQLHRMREKLV